MSAAETLVFHSAVDDPAAWKAALARELPDLAFAVAGEEDPSRPVRYALAWEPPPGFFARYGELRLIVNLGAGVDRLVARDDLRPDTPISRLSDPGMVDLMTSYVVFAVTRYARDMHHFERAQRQRRWQYIHPRALSEIKVAVLGLGQLGGPAAAALARLGFPVTGWSRSPKAVDGVTCRAGTDSLHEVLGEAEIVVCLLPLTPETDGLLGAAEFAAMRPGAKFVNASRALVTDEEALLAALRSGHVAEATIDVFKTKPLHSDHPFWSMENVYLTPHLASITVPEAAVRDVAESIRRVRRGEPPLHAVDPRRGY